MTKRIQQLALQAGYTPDKFGVGHWDKPECQKYAQLIVQECMTINKVETPALDLPEYNLGMLEGYRRARENMSIHFGVEE